MIVVWKPKITQLLKNLEKNKKSVSPLELEIFIRTQRICLGVVRFFSNAVERGRIRKPLENTRVNNQFGIRSGLKGAPKKCLGGDGRTKKSEEKVMSNDPEI